MKDFSLFDISDFVMDEDFIRWVNEKSRSDNEFWENWLSQHEDKYMVVAEARRILESIGTEQNIISEEEKQQEVNRLMNTIRGDIRNESEAPVRLLNSTKKWWYAAATLLVAVAGTALYFTLQEKKQPGKFSYAVIIPSKRLIENINTSEKPITLKLPDESTVELAANSRIAYANNFDSSGTRDIYLSGEAFFKVTKNPARPFRVFANEIVTKVLGTSFVVRSFEKDTIIQITVRTGKVSVYSQASRNASETSSPNQLGGIILTPNQELVYERAKQKFEKGLLDNPAVILNDAEYQKAMLYEDQPVVNVFARLSKIYGINIVYDGELLRKCSVTADLRNETFYSKLELICKAVGARYEVIDGQIVIQTNGCD